MTSELCANCQRRPASIDWVGDGGALAWVHGLKQRWCEPCALVAQLAYAKQQAARIPFLEARLRKIGGA